MNSRLRPGPWLLAEGGGSRTWVAVLGDRTTQLVGPSTNAFTAAGADAGQRLRDLLRAVLASAGVSGPDIDLVFVAHGAAATSSSARHFADLLTEVLSEFAVDAQLIVTSDMVPVITSDHGHAVIAAIVGTGTVFAAHRDLRRWARAGGADYLLSDEGSGFDLGMNGLRAAIRATDGRGQATDLVDRALQWVAGPGQVSLADALYERVYVAHPRSVVAQFAHSVLDSAREGDVVAVELIEHAADEFLAGVRAVAERVGIASESPRVILSGSLATVDSALREAMLARLHGYLAPAAITNYEPQDLAAKASGIVRLIDGGGEQLEGLSEVLPVVVRRVP